MTGTLHQLTAELARTPFDPARFAAWYAACRWETTHASDPAALALGWDIANILAEYHAYPDTVSAADVHAAIMTAIETASAHPVRPGPPPTET
jgi:hypothetical protein